MTGGNIAELGFEVHSDSIAKATDRADKLTPAVDKAERATDRFNNTNVKGRSAVDNMAAGLGGLTTMVARLATGLAAYLSVNALVSYADAWSDMQSRVGAAIGNMEAAPALMQRLVDVANASYSPLSQTVEIYGRNVAVLRDLGRTAAETADFTESLNHMLVITATRGERAASVQNALSKAMAVGKLQAEGLETVLANGGRVAEALADELGTTVSGLRALASEGKITGDVIARAIINPLAQVREEAGAMTATVADAFVIMNNNITAAIGQFDKMHGISATLASGIIYLAENLDIVGAAAAGVAATITVALLPGLIALTPAMWAFTAAVLANPLTWLAIAVGAVVTAVVLLVQHLGGLGNAFQTVQMIAMGVWERIQAGGNSLSMAIAGVSLKIEASFAGAFAGIMSGWDALVQKLGPGAQLLGIDASQTSAYVNQLKADAEALDAAATAAFASAGKFWSVATGPGAKMDIVGQGASWSEFNAVLGQTAETAGTIPPAINAVGDAATKTTPKVLQATEAVKNAFKEASETFDFYKQTFGSFMSGMRRDLMAGTSLWDSFKNAASRALDSIADRAFSMAANGFFDMIFGALRPNSAGAGWGVMGGFAGRPGMFGLPGFNTGGYTGDTGGVVHPREFVLNAQATRSIGTDTLHAMNMTGVAPANDNGGFVYQDNRSYDFSGSAMTREEIEEILADDRAALIADMPNIVKGINADPRKRKSGTR